MPLENQAANIVTATASSLAVPVSANTLNCSPVTATVATSSGQTSAATTATDKTDAVGSKKSTLSGALRTTHESSNVTATQQAIHPVAEQSSSSGTALDAAAVTREGNGLHGAASASAGTAQATTGSTTELTSEKAFAALDATDATDKTTWVHTGTQRAEAGFQDASLGWVSVRANLDKGGVHAELVASSTDAAQVLGSHMAELNSYLAEHHTPVNTLTLSSSESGWTGLSNGTGTGAGMQQETGQQTGQQMAQSVTVDSLSNSSPAVTSAEATTSEPSAWSGTLDGSTQAEHISLIA